MTNAVTYQQQDRIVYIALNRPDTRNALSKDVVEQLVESLERAHNDPSVNCVVLSGNGKGFSSGGNLQEIRAMTTTDQMSTAELEDWYVSGIQQIPLAMAKIDVITIAAVHGHAVGAGCDLAAMCDLRIAARDAVFSESFLKLGIIPGDGGSWFLPRVIGMARTKEMLFTAEGVSAEKALEWGLVREIVDNDELLDAATRLARTVTSWPPTALRTAKQLLRTVETTSLQNSLNTAAKMQAMLQQQEDHLEAIDAILEKRSPAFKGC